MIRLNGKPINGGPSQSGEEDSQRALEQDILRRIQAINPALDMSQVKVSVNKKGKSIQFLGVDDETIRQVQQQLLLPPTT